MEGAMAQSQSLAVQEKKELSPKEEKTVPAKYFIPNTDIYETEDALAVLVELPGVEKKDLIINLENETLRIEGRIDFSKYEGLEPVYAEYNVGPFLRTFALTSGKFDQNGISAEFDDGVLTLTLKKAKAELPTRIEIK
jgi:HSP20 family molecular chaperone IbpA